jgi:uncharacterized membrane protein YkoI
MKRAFLFCMMVSSLYIFDVYAEQKLKVKDLPKAVQKTVQDLVKDAELKGLSKEEEKGQTVYEVETLKNGKTRDARIDARGVILEVEAGSTLKEIPGPAKAAIEKAAMGGEIWKVEAVTKNGVTAYEAAITKAGKNTEIKVTSDGSIIR